MSAIAALARPRRAAITVVGALTFTAVAISVALFSQLAGANTSNLPTGQYSFVGKSLTQCPLGAVFCSSGTLTGTLAGTLDVTLTTVQPTTTLGVNFFSGRVVVQTSGGRLVCQLNGALNTGASSQGEFAEICLITGGTGMYQGASGHLRLYGVSTTSQLVVPTGHGDYTGTIVTPASP